MVKSPFGRGAICRGNGCRPLTIRLQGGVRREYRVPATVPTQADSNGGKSMGELALQAVGILLLVTGFILINFDAKFRTHRIPVSMGYAAITWLLVGVGKKLGWIPDFHEKLVEAKISSIDIMVLMISAMLIVEILILNGFFDYIGWYIQRKRWKDTLQLAAIASVAFPISILYDNATATIVMLPVTLRFFQGINLYLALGSVVVGANAGGAGSPFGDFSTIILWLAGRFETGELVLVVGSASIVAHVVSVWDLSTKLVGDTPDNITELSVRPEVNWTVVSLSFLAVPFVFLFRWLELDVFFGFVLGGALTLMFYGFVVMNGAAQETEGDVAHDELTPIERDIRELYRNIDKETITFIVFLILFVEGLTVLGALDWLGFIFGIAENYPVLLFGLMAVMGPISSMVDNIVLVLVANSSLDTADSLVWLYLAYNVAIGGALLIYGSLPGIIIKTVPGMSFRTYLRYITPSVAKGYVAGLALITAVIVVLKTVG